jgi:energy-coupling factor transporter ATP-binding protein EcfA2
METCRKAYYPEGWVRKEFLTYLNNKIQKMSDGKKNLVLNDEIERAIDLVCAYANNEPKFEEEGFDFSKGIMLVGKTGSGKTLLMRALYAWRKAQLQKPIAWHNCKQVNVRFLEIDAHTGKHRGFYGVKDFCSIKFDCEKIFDDLGKEETFVQNYGNKISIMDYVLDQRYDSRKTCGRTHITTNLSFSSIQQKYGSRLESRCHQLFNVIKLGTEENSVDHRKTK